MDIKEELNSIKWLEIKKKDLEEELETIETYMQGIDTTKENVQSSNQSDLSNIVFKINELKENIEEQIERIAEEKLKLINLISGLQGNEYTVIFKHYIQRKSWEQISQETNYSTRQVWRIHGHALQALRKDVIECH